MAAANAQIGVAVAAFYPDVTLSADYGASAATLRKLFTASSRDLVVRLDARRRRSSTAALRSAQVEQAQRRLRPDRRQLPPDRADRVPAGRGRARGRAHPRAAGEGRGRRGRRGARGRADHQQPVPRRDASPIPRSSSPRPTALADAETAVNIRQSRLVASVALIEALGGGWDAAQLPSRDQIEENARSISTRCRHRYPR